MTKTYKTVDGLKLAAGVDYALIPNEGRISDEEFDAELKKKPKIRVTTMLDIDVVEELKRQGVEKGVGYQTLLNSTLRSALFGKHSEQFLSFMHRMMVEVLSRLEKLEKGYEPPEKPSYARKKADKKPAKYRRDTRPSAP